MWFDRQHIDELYVYFLITIPQSSCNLTIGPHQIDDKFISNFLESNIIQNVLLHY